MDTTTGAMSGSYLADCRALTNFCTSTNSSKRTIQFAPFFGPEPTIRVNRLNSTASQISDSKAGAARPELRSSHFVQPRVDKKKIVETLVS